MSNVKFKFDEKALNNLVKEAATNAVHDKEFEIECPYCHRTFGAYSGTNTCPYCKNTVELTLNINF